MGAGSAAGGAGGSRGLLGTGDTKPALHRALLSEKESAARQDAPLGPGAGAGQVCWGQKLAGEGRRAFGAGRAAADRAGGRPCRAAGTKPAEA